MRKLLAIAVGLLLATGATADGAEIKLARNVRTFCDVDEAPRETRPDDAIMSGRGTATRPLSLALLGISNSSLRPKPRPFLITAQPAARSSCSIAFSRFLRARSMALTSFGEILPVVMSVSILH